MSSNKLASFRYRILNECFRNIKKPLWSLEELIKHISEKLIEDFDVSRINDDGFAISKRTIQGDIALMKSEPPRGYFAPIVVDRRMYSYSDRNFSIHHSPPSETDKATLQDAALLLRQFNGLPHFEALEETLLHIQCWADTETQQQLVQFEQNEYSGIAWLKPLYEALQRKKPILLRYQPFLATAEEHKMMHPYFLKEYRNRWYVVGYDESLKQITNAALDRVVDVKTLEMKPFKPYPKDFSPATYFQNVIGVTVYNDAAVETIRFKVAPQSANYLKTKKLHASQQEIGVDEDWTIFELRVQINFELKAELFRFGSALEVIAPTSLRADFQVEFERLTKQYGT